nr:amidohydrolase family protein [Gordonia sp. LAM0048]
MTATLPTNEVPDALHGIKIIDADAHLTEPADLWTSRVPASMKHKVPVQRTVDGITAWYLDDKVWASTGGNTISTGREKVLGSHVVQPFANIDVSSWDVQERLALMDEQGIYAQILYPNGIGFASNHVFAIEDEEVRTLVLQIYNDFLMESQEESNGRLFPQGLLPIWDMDLTIKEMERLIDRGMRGFTLSDKPELIGLPELPEPYFAPMWDLFNTSGAVPNFHIGAGARREDMEAMRGNIGQKASGTAGPEVTGVVKPSWRSFGRQRQLAVGATQMFMSNVRIIINLCMSDLFDRYPNLQVVSAESGIGWIPFILEAMEFQFDEMVTHDHELAAAKRRPSEYFRDHLFAMFWFEEIGAAKLLEDVGVDRVLVETDIPHPTCLFPGPREHFARVMGGLPIESQRKVLQDNGAKLYNIALD